MHSEGTDVTKVQVMSYKENLRGLHTSCDVKKGNTILLVPNKLILAYETVKRSPIAAKMIDLKLENDYGQHILFVAYFMEERRKRKEDRQYGCYIDCFPNSFENFPIFFNET